MKRKKTVAPVIVSVLSVILTIALTSMLLLTFSMRQAARKSSVSDVIAEMNLDQFSISEKNGSKTPLTEYLLQNFISSDTVTSDEIAELLRDGTFDEFTADYISRYSDYLLYGGEMPSISSEDISKVLYENEDLIREKTGLEIDEDAFRQKIDDAIADINAAAVSSIQNKVVRSAFSVWAEIIPGILLLLVLLWLILTFVLAGRSAGTALIIFGFSALGPSLLMLAASLAVDGILRLVRLDAFAGAVTPIRNDLYINGGIAGLTALILAASGLVINLLTSRKAPSVSYRSSVRSLPVYDPHDSYYRHNQQHSPEKRISRKERSAATTNTAPLPKIRPEDLRSYPAQPQHLPEKTRCPQCYAATISGASFCSQCGYRL